MKKQNEKPALSSIVECAVCGKRINLGNAKEAGLRLAWFDPYVKDFYILKGHKGAYVCHGCLSKKRMAEILEAESAAEVNAETNEGV